MVVSILVGVSWLEIENGLMMMFSRLQEINQRPVVNTVKHQEGRYGICIVMNSENDPEQIHLDLHEVEERDMQYLTIGIVVNAPYGSVYDDDMIA